jgi:uncharacterized repeat protein (TIGR01451 family)
MNIYDRIIHKAGKISYILSAAFLIAALLVNMVPAPSAYAATGTVWTTAVTCDTPAAQDQNQYYVGQIVYVRGSGFATNLSVSWKVTGPDGSSPIYDSGTFSTGTGSFCIETYHTSAADVGRVMKFTVYLTSTESKLKSDNFSVTDNPLSLVKDGSLDLGSNQYLNAGDTISYSLVVTNNGKNDLTNVSVTDPLLGTVTCPGGNPIAVLAKNGGTVTCTGTYTLQLSDLTAGKVDNTATADSNETLPVTASHTETLPDLPIFGCTDPTYDNYNPNATVDDGSCANEPVLGCTDPNATNYNPEATLDDGSCEYPPVQGCTDPNAINYNPEATLDDGSCEYPPVQGCTDPNANNYNPEATLDDGSCEYPPVQGCTDPNATNYNPEATLDDGSCEYPPVQGCTDPAANNYNELATVDDGSCTYDPDPIPGCTDPAANNYNELATVDDGSCTYDPDPIPGCTDPAANNYNELATVDDGSCTYDPDPIPGCTDPAANNYNELATVDDGSCTYDPDPIPGCTDPNANNYNELATVDDGSCTYNQDPILGCTDPNATNFNPSATQDDGSCRYPQVQVQVLIPVTGIAHGAGRFGSQSLFLVSVSFFGLGLVLDGIGRKRKDYPM